MHLYPRNVTFVFRFYPHDSKFQLWWNGTSRFAGNDRIRLTNDEPNATALHGPFAGSITSVGIWGIVFSIAYRVLCKPCCVKHNNLAVIGPVQYVFYKCNENACGKVSFNEGRETYSMGPNCVGKFFLYWFKNRPITVYILRNCSLSDAHNRVQWQHLRCFPRIKQLRQRLRYILTRIQTNFFTQIINMFALGPVATVGHIKQGMLKILAPYVNILSVS